MNINLNNNKAMTVRQYKEKRLDLITMRREYELKQMMGIKFEDGEFEHFERIDALIDQCDFIIDYMIREDEETYEWSWGTD